MRKNLVLGLIASVSLMVSATAASALELDVNIDGVFTDLSFTTLASDFVVDAGRDNATVTLAAGQGIALSIDIGNAPGDDLSDIFTTIVIEGSDLNFLGGSADPEVLVGGPPFAPTSLTRVAQPGIKVNSPNANGTSGDVWVQSTAYASTGTNGTGPNPGAVSLFFEVTGASGSDLLDFQLTLTQGDVVSPSSTLVLSGATINVPEPGTALLMGLGLAGLAAAGRRRE